MKNQIGKSKKNASKLFIGIVTTAIIMSSGLNAAAQDKSDSLHRKAQLSFFYPLGSNGVSKAYSHNYSFNIIYGMNSGVDGFELGGIANYNEGNVTGTQIAGISNYTKGDVAGLQWAGIINANKGSMQGAQISGIANYTSGQLRACNFPQSTLLTVKRKVFSLG
ncbi:MAG: hypothetical protein GY816_07365 [Cytophagales bacterium]|nr:hypothetical protein [Cytophagales bacterium]